MSSGHDHGEPLAHHVLIYDTDEQFLAATLPFCRDGLERGEAVLAVTTPANVTLLREALGRDAERVEFASASGWYRTPGRTLAAYHRYVQDREDAYPRIRIIGEPVWNDRDAVETDEWLRYEAAINKAFAGSRAWIVCPYDTRGLPVSVVAGARCAHSDLMHGDAVLPSPHYSPPDVQGSGWERRPRPPSGASAACMEFGSDLSAVRAFAAARATELGLPAESLDRLVFSVNETASNALRHGDGRRFLTLWRDGERVVCDVTDTGGTSPPWYSGYLPPSPDQASGHGMWTVRQLCDLVEIHSLDPGTLVRLQLDARRGP
ncbi:anti-sigma factor RsbA family regulatory protein [Actinocorallia populi]|uniref:anti-sigma factor RsbA family regulatory protein n=1 Tax=Actinocorallia populi TaxID=2079200 RepID=UPI000D08830D|nr:anti-sigma factor RsbA family regulatory protein [Actinocorallia populi]